MAKKILEEPKKPFPPFEYEYEEKIVKKFIYQFSESLREDDYDDDDEDDEEEEKKENIPDNPPQDISLAWLMTLVPEGIKPEQIKMDFGYNASCMSYDDHYVGFYYEVTVPARKAELLAARAKYESDLRQYEKDLKAYKEAKRLNDIKETEAKLAKLKGK